MKGTFHLTVQSAFLKYEMDFSRNITIIQGNSATGKTTLVEMIQEYVLNGSDTGISLSCACPCRIVAGATWKEQLSLIDNSIVFIDEGNRFVASEEFAKTIRGTGNYYVIVTRENLDNLPYSVNEIYGIRSSGKYGSLTPVYHHMFRIYSADKLTEGKAEKVILEDSNAGFQFFEEAFQAPGVSCLSAGGAANLFHLIQEVKASESATVIADGAAFGAQMGRVYALVKRKGNIRLYLPESFEWLLLSSGIVGSHELHEILENPSDHIESREYFSWERFFTALLVELTKDSYLRYSKRKLNQAYLQDRFRDRILAVLPKALRELIS